MGANSLCSHLDPPTHKGASNLNIRGEIMKKRVVILGGGTAGTMVVNRLHKKLNPDEWSITLVDKDNMHVYQPGLLLDEAAPLKVHLI